MRPLLLGLGVFVSFFLSMLSLRYYTGIQKIPQMSFLVFSLIGSMFACTLFVLARKWHMFLKNPDSSWKEFLLSPQFRRIAFSGFCTAIIIPTSTILYTIPGINVSLAQVPMKAATILAGVLVALFLGQLISSWQWFAGVTAVLAMATAVFWKDKGSNPFDDPLAKTCVILAVICYPIRVGLMRTFLESIKGLSDEARNRASKAYFAWEQLCAFGTIILTTGILIVFFPESVQIKQVIWAFKHLPSHVDAILVSGTPYSMYALTTVMLLMYEGSAIIATIGTKLASVPSGILVTLAAQRMKFPNAAPVKTAETAALILITIALFFLITEGILKMRRKSRSTNARLARLNPATTAS